MFLQPKEYAPPKPMEFSISPASLQNAHKNYIPSFKIVGHLNSTVCSVNKPFTGQVSLFYQFFNFFKKNVVLDNILNYYVYVFEFIHFLLIYYINNKKTKN